MMNLAVKMRQTDRQTVSEICLYFGCLFLGGNEYKINT